VTSLRPAAFLDRDGTIIEDVDYISRPEDVRLLPGAADAIRTLNDARVPVIVVSNQSGIGRGYFTRDAYEHVQARVEQLLGQSGAHLDATYICPHAPSQNPPCACRKPKVELFDRAARDHGIDLSRSWYVGDKWRDAEPARTLGGSAFLIPARSTPAEDLERARSLAVVRTSLGDVAAEIIATLTAGHGRR
jgi:D-glycero-D-manno-heptose 1,7-bisphosphate phosphatase